MLQRLDGSPRDFLEGYEYVNGRTGYRDIVRISSVHHAIAVSFCAERNVEVIKKNVRECR